MAGGAATNGTGAPPQAGVLEGVNPIAYSPSNPITLFIIQASGEFSCRWWWSGSRPVCLSIGVPGSMFRFAAR